MDCKSILPESSDAMGLKKLAFGKSGLDLGWVFADLGSGVLGFCRVCNFRKKVLIFLKKKIIVLKNYILTSIFSII